MTTPSSLPKPPTPIDRVEFYKNALAPYTNHGTARVKRHWEFLISEPTHTLYFGARAIVTVGAGIGAGVKIAQNSPEGARKTATVVCGVGGAFVGAVTYMTITERNRDYSKWINVKMDYIIESSVYNKYSDDPVLVSFVCALRQTLSPIPARTPYGHLFDFNYLMECERDQNGLIKCPMTRKKFHESKLKMDFEASLFINKRMYCLTASDLNAVGTEGPLKESLLRQMEKTKNCIKICYSRCLEIIDGKLAKEKITFDECQEERNVFAVVFGKTPEHQLDWALDWKDILDKRWRASNPKV